MRILLLAYHYPPDPAVGSLRPGRLASALCAAGHSIEVVTACLPGEPPGLRHEEPGLRVHAVVPWRNPLAMALAWREAWRGLVRSSKATTDPTGRPKVQGVTHDPVPRGFLRRHVLALLLLPDNLQGFIPVAVRLGRRLARRQAFDLHYTSAPPHSVTLAGLVLGFLDRRSPWVMELRDPWSHRRRQYSSTGWSRWLVRRVERICLKRARAVVTNTVALAEKLRGDVPDPGSVVTVLNGIPALPARPMVPEGPFSIVHLGTIYAGRNPFVFLEALALLRARRSLRPDAFRCEFVGAGPSYGGRSLAEAITALGLSDMVTLRERLPFEDATRLAAASDLLLLLAQEQPDQVPNKLYDYLALDRPILAVADEEGESARLLHQVGGHQVLPAGATPENMARAIESVMDRPRGRRPTGDRLLLEEWSVERQMAKLVSLIEAAGGR